jgi:hypothetical protein
MIYDIHALQERFYFHNATIPSLHTTLPLLFERLKTTNITSVAFPDAGAAKRFSHLFNEDGYDIIICGKVRDGLKRKIYIQEGITKGNYCLYIHVHVCTKMYIYLITYIRMYLHVCLKIFFTCIYSKYSNLRIHVKFII